MEEPIREIKPPNTLKGWIAFGSPLDLIKWGERSATPRNEFETAGGILPSPTPEGGDQPTHPTSVIPTPEGGDQPTHPAFAIPATTKPIFSIISQTVEHTTATVILVVDLTETITNPATAKTSPVARRIIITTSPMTRSHAKSLSPEVLALQVPSPIQSACLLPVKTTYKGKQNISEEDNSSEYSTNIASDDTSSPTSLTDEGDALNVDTDADVDIGEGNVRVESPLPDAPITHPDTSHPISVTSVDDEEQLNYGEYGCSPGANIFLSFDAPYSPCIMETVNVVTRETSILKDAEAQSSEIHVTMGNVLLLPSTEEIFPLVPTRSDSPIQTNKFPTVRPSPIQPIARSLEFLSNLADVPTPSTLNSSTIGA
ncbi:uncharacterized protein LOC131238949 [Magnolia sinica]|uniref:uncharacterized protein LOC131238949 n=1 Tax=Magnolia sinica TaxID=86752 RepID=UPI002659AF3C|nr:uncharacterized protein LOC131238949 [Magnolia sinica]